MTALLKWYVDTKVVLAYGPTEDKPGLPLLALALGLKFWTFPETVERDPQPDYKTVETLLLKGCNPSAPYNGHSIWEYTISYVHILNLMPNTQQCDLITWLHHFKLLLEHGADPHACCVEGCDAWWIRRGMIQNQPFIGPENELPTAGIVGVGNNVNSPIRTSAIGLLQHLQLLYLPSELDIDEHIQQVTLYFYYMQY
jgi:hypothetical protein